MKIFVSVYLPFPRPLVYATYRDKLLEIMAQMPEGQQITLKSTTRSNQNGCAQDINQWRGSGEIPAVARPFLSDAMLEWTDYATWNDSEFVTDWRIETQAFPEAVYCAGRNQFLQQGSGTSIASQGELKINPKKLKGVPSFFAGAIAPILETVLSQKIEPNFVQISQGVQSYLEHHSSS